MSASHKSRPGWRHRACARHPCNTWRAIFAVLGGLGGAVLVVTVIRLGETNKQRVRLDLSGMAGANLALLRSPAFVGFAVCGACTSASWFTFIASAPHILAEALRQPPSTYGLMILLPMATYMLGNAAAARFVPRFGSLQLLLAGRVLAFAAALAFSDGCSDRVPAAFAVPCPARGWRRARCRSRVVAVVQRGAPLPPDDVSCGAVC
jgi:predicted MFS family arabinose efflux permease